MKVEIRSVIDGSTFTLDDDGHYKGDPSRPNSRRAQLLRTLKEKAADGRPAFFLTEQPRGFRSGEVMMEPVEGDVWGDKNSKGADADERHVALRRQREDQKRERPKPAPLPLASEIERAERAAENAHVSAATVSRGKQRPTTAADATAKPKAADNV